MTKTGTMTFCTDTSSHGANLQAYALQRTLLKMGHENDIIHYTRSANVIDSRRSVVSLAKHKVWKSISGFLPTAREKARRTEEFRARHLLFSTKKYSDDRTLWSSPPEYDAYITGSDQVWNPRYVREEATDSPWFLGFTPTGRKRISYGASFGISRLPREEEERYRRWLNEMDHISTREFEGQEIIRHLTGRDAELLVDPTLLLSAEEWSELAVPFASRRPYVLCYYMPGYEKVTRTISSMAQRLSAMTGWEIVTVGLKDYWMLNPFVHGVFDAGPLELLGLIQGASFVLTNSFHGTAFSIIFRKPFAVPIDMHLSPEKAMSSRITTLLSLLKLGDRAVEAGKTRVRDSLLDIDYQYADSALKSEKEKSTSFLARALKEVW